MKKLRKTILGIVICLFIITIGGNKIEAQEAFDILSHTIDVNVCEDGTLEIAETMEVHFTESRHGIYINIPKNYSMKWEDDGKTVTKNYYFPVTSVNAKGSHTSIKYDENGVVIRIGDSNSYANEYETYQWSYKIVTKDLDLNGKQMLFLNLITSGWDTTTDKCTFTIHMPKSFDSSKISTVYPNGMLQGTGSKDGLTIKVSGNTITGSYDNKIQSDGDITIQVGLDDDYFVFPNLNERSVFPIVFGGVMAAVISVIFFLIGKDDQLIVTPEYHIPADLNSAEVGMILNETADDRNITSLILDWGRKGIITIEETKDDLLLTAKNDLEFDARPYEKTLYDGIFASGKVVKLSSLNGNFYDTFNKAKKELGEYFNDSVRKLSTDISKEATYIIAAICSAPTVIAMVLVVYGYYRNGVLAGAMGFMVYAFLELCITMLIVYTIEIYNVNSSKKTMSIIMAVIFFIIPFVALLFMYIEAKISWINYISIILLQLLIIVVTSFMRKRTLYGNAMLGRILGLRDFIKNADNDRLLQLQEDNPFYYYDILPYAYSLGLINVWTEHFRKLDVKPCDWYIIYGISEADHYHRMHSLDSHMSNLQNSFSSVPVSEGGGSSSGGGFSGGGGFGGSSGGSW